MSEAEHDIAIKMGLTFATVVEDYMALAKEALERQAEGKTVSFGAMIQLRKEKGLVLGKFIPKAPKIQPKAIHDDQHFVLQSDEGGQLEFVYAGSLKELRVSLEEQAAKDRELADAGLDKPGDNTGGDEVPDAPVLID